MVPGCAWLGPEIIRAGRPAYNDAIIATNDEQSLQNIVRLLGDLGTLHADTSHQALLAEGEGIGAAGQG